MGEKIIIALITLASGIIVGGAVSWILSRYYYKKQVKEQVNPTPHIKAVNTAVLELYGMAVQRQDGELQKAVKQLVIEMLHTRNRVLNKVVPAQFVITWVREINSSNKGDEIQQLKELEKYMETAQNNLIKVGYEYDGLIEVVEQVAGQQVVKMFTYEEFKEILRDPRSASRVHPE